MKHTKQTGKTEKPLNSSYADYEAREGAKERRWAYIRAKTLRKNPCNKCGLHLCICQSVLADFGGK